MKISNFKLGIGIPASMQHVPVAFFDSFIQMERPTFSYLPAKNGPINDLRNRIVEQAFIIGCSHIIMMDTDQIYPKDTITKLLSHKLPIVHGVVHRRYPPFDSLLYKGELNKYVSMIEGIDYKKGELIEIDACGTGCVLYDMRVFHKIKPPWFEFIKNPDKTKGGVVGEDIGFCVRLKKAGFKIYADTSVEITHLTYIGIDENFSILYRSLVKRQMELNKTKEDILINI